MREPYKAAIVLLLILLTLSVGWHIISTQLGGVSPRDVWEWISEKRKPSPPPPSPPSPGVKNATPPYSKLTPEVVCFAMPQIAKDPFTQTYDRLYMEGCGYITTPGHPMLPVKTVCFKLNRGYTIHQVTVEVRSVKELSGTYLIMPALTPTHLDEENATAALSEPDPEIYSSSEAYPGEWFTYRLASGLDPDTMARVTYVIVQLYPVQYVPAEGKVYVAEELKISVGYEGEPETPVHVADLLIITGPQFLNQSIELARYRNSTGIRTLVLTTDWIYANYEGVDEQERIRNCIKDFVERFGINYVLLFGDHEVVPARLVYIPDGAYDGTDIDGVDVETDLYYADLQYSWDDNGDGKWGDLRRDRIDGIPDIFVGRLPASTPEEAETLVDKIIGYETTTSIDLDWFRTITLAGTDPFGPEGAEGEIIKDYVEQNFVWPDFNVVKLYETQGTLCKETVKEKIDAGCGIFNHVGHGDITVWKLPGKWRYYTVSDAKSQTNGYKLPVITTLSCLTARFSDADCLAEAFVLNPNGGAIAYLGSTRIAWGYVGQYATVGLGGEMDWRLCKAFFDGKRELGRLWAQAITEYVENHDLHTRYDEQFYLDWKTVAEYGAPLGDPTLLIGGRGAPASIAVHAVDKSGDPVEGLTIKLYTEQGYTLGVEKTNSTGWAVFPSIVKGNYTVYAYKDGVQVARHLVSVAEERKTVELVCGLYDYAFEVVDGDGEPVANANITIYLNGQGYASAVTDLKGRAVVEDLPPTTYQVTVKYHKVDVYNGTITVSEQEAAESPALTLPAKIYDLKLRCVDVGGYGVGGVFLYLVGPTDYPWIRMTDGSGWAEFVNLPSANYTCSVVYKGVELKRDFIQLLSGDQVKTEELELYPLAFQVLDAGWEPLPNATVSVYHQNGTLVCERSVNATGWAIFPGLFPSNYRYEAVWRGAQVCVGNVTLDGSKSVRLVTKVYDAVLAFKELDGEPVSNVYLQLFNSTGVVWEQWITGEGALIENLVEGVYSYKLYYLGEEVSAGSFNLTEQAQHVEVPCNLYDWELTLLDEDGEPLPNAEVRLRLWNGTLYASYTTNSDGKVRFENLPPQEYEIRALWQGVEVATTRLKLEAEEQADQIGCGVYTLTVKVLSQEGTPVIDANITLTWPNGTTVVAATDKDGIAIFKRLPATTYNLKIEAENYNAYEGAVDLRATRSFEAFLEEKPLWKIPAIPLPGEKTVQLGVVVGALVVIAVVLALM